MYYIGTIPDLCYWYLLMLFLRITPFMDIWDIGVFTTFRYFIPMSWIYPIITLVGSRILGILVVLVYYEDTLLPRLLYSPFTLFSGLLAL